MLVGSGVDPRQPFYCAAADLNGDGRLDLTTSNNESDNLSIFMQSAPGAFANEPDNEPDLELGTSATTKVPRSLAAADLNGDGLVDLVSANSESDNLALFHQGSPGRFATAPDAVLGSTAATREPTSVVAGDLNGDGRVDLASANAATSNLSVFFQPQTGGFVDLVDPDENLGPADGPQALDVADLDGDGDLDLISANRGGGNATVFFQTEPGAFDPTPVVLGDPLTTVLPGSLVAADLDGDGRVDDGHQPPLGEELAPTAPAHLCGQRSWTEGRASWPEALAFPGANRLRGSSPVSRASIVRADDGRLSIRFSMAAMTSWSSRVSIPAVSCDGGGASPGRSARITRQRSARRTLCAR